MNLSTIPKIKEKKKKRLGRGAGSGKAKTSGRGQKGQNARGKMSIGHSHYEGGQRSIIKRLPYRRGKGNGKVSKKPIPLNISLLEKLPVNSVVDANALIENRIVNKEELLKRGVKIVGKAEIKKKLTIKVSITNTAAILIEKAGGKVLI